MKYNTVEVALEVKVSMPVLWDIVSKLSDSFNRTREVYQDILNRISDLYFKEHEELQTMDTATFQKSIVNPHTGPKMRAFFSKWFSQPDFNINEFSIEEKEYVLWFVNILTNFSETGKPEQVYEYALSIDPVATTKDADGNEIPVVIITNVYGDILKKYKEYVEGADNDTNV